MRVSEIMTKPVITVRFDTPVRDASALLAQHHITSIPVLDDDGNVIGIVSELDLLRDRIPRGPRAHLSRYDEQRPDPGRFVGDVMSDAVVCLSENADAADVVDVMVTDRVRAVPIISGAALVGLWRSLADREGLVEAAVFGRHARKSGVERLLTGPGVEVALLGNVDSGRCGCLEQGDFERVVVGPTG